MNKKQPDAYLCGLPVYYVDKLPSLPPAEATPLAVFDPPPPGPEPPYAGRLVDLARQLRQPKDELVVALRPLDGARLAEVKLAVDFVARGPGFVFRALVEGWNRTRVVREVY
jgi:hypothetical protein